MIRINLLPVRQVRKIQAGQRQLVLFVALFLAELLLFGFFYYSKAEERDAKQRQITNLQADIERLRREVGDYEQLEAQRDQLIAQRKVINDLSSSRMGPIRAMRELSSILSITGHPTYDQQAYDEMVRRDPSIAINPRWNPRRLWIEQFNERGGQVTITGRAKDHADVAEFLKRMNLSRYFGKVQLRRNDQVVDRTYGVKVVRFSMSCSVQYRLDGGAA